MNQTISIQGDAASFHDIAAAQYFGDSERIFCESFVDTVAALTAGRAEYALCAIENSLYGSINDVYDLILKNKLYITGEVYLRIEQCLIGLPGAKIEDITTVHSHPVALAQCEDYLDSTLLVAERNEYHDTAASVELIKTLGDPTQAAIAGAAAAELYGMEVVAHSIETNKENYTRFVVLGREPQQSADTTKTSLVLRTDHAPGALYRALGTFAQRSINLSKIQSRPIIGKAWHYLMYVDVEAGSGSTEYAGALADLGAQGCDVTFLGSYASGQKS